MIQGAAAVRQFLFQRCSRSQNGRSLHMVAAGMTHHLQRVILTQQADAGSFPTAADIFRPESGGKAPHTTLHLKTMLFQKICEQRQRMGLLMADLRMVKDIVCHSTQTFPLLVNVSKKFFLHLSQTPFAAA